MARAGRGFILKPLRPLIRKTAAAAAVVTTTTGLAPVGIATLSAARSVTTTTGTSAIGVGSSSLARLGITTTTGTSAINVSSTSAAKSIAKTTGTSAIGVGSSSLARSGITTTGLSPIGIGSSGTVTLYVVWGRAPIGVGSVGTARAVTTGRASIEVGSSSADYSTDSTWGQGLIEVFSVSRTLRVIDLEAYPGEPYDIVIPV